MKTKLLNNIEAKLTGNKVMIDSPFIKVSYDEENPDNIHLNPDYALECRVGVTLGGTQLIPTGLTDEALVDVLSYAKTNAGRAIANEVYGELRSKLIELNYQMRSEGYNLRGESLQMVNQMLEMISYE